MDANQSIFPADRCRRLDLASELREWEEVASLKRNRAFFPMLTAGDGYIYAFEGGKPYATKAFDDVER